MLTVSQVSKSHGGRILFEDASLQINRGDRFGLIGPNGAGKSTLFSLILNEQSPDSGSVSLQRGITLGFLPQESAPSGSETILQLATSINAKMEEAYQTMRLFPDENAHEHLEAQTLFIEQNGFVLEAKAKRILIGLAFRESDFQREARTMSGGWIMRAHLARLLVMEPDLLMLDEPTNHLDLETLGWFQNYLTTYRGAILTISHDREFLNAICDNILEIRHKRLHRYRGNYDAYEEQRKAREEQHLAAYRNQQKEIQALQRFADRFRAKASKAAQAQEKLKQIERMEKIEAPESEEATVHFAFPQPPRSGQRVLRLDSVCQAYDSHVVYENLNLTVERGQRLVLVGPNGAGKSTLLKIIASLVPLSHGVCELGHHVSLGYFSQHRAEMLNAKHTVIEEAMDLPNPASEQITRTLLGSFLFRGDDVFKPVGVLSGGEKSRLALVKLLLAPPNLLLLDEPTTHLDMASIDALIGALRQYSGTLIFVSHDVHFIRALGNHVLHIHAGNLTPYAGGYDYYLEKTHAVSAREALISPLSNHRPTQPEPTVPSEKRIQGIGEIREQRKLAAQQRQETAKERRAQEKLAKKLEAEILRLEATQKELTQQLESPETYETPSTALELNRKLIGITETLERLTSEWEQAVEALQMIEIQ